MGSMKDMGVKCTHKDDEHEPHGYNKDTKIFVTSEEAEYPPIFCQKMAEAVHKQLNAKAWLAQEKEWVRYDAVNNKYAQVSKVSKQ